MTKDEAALVWLCGGEFEYRERAALLRAARSPADLMERAETLVPAVLGRRPSPPGESLERTLIRMKEIGASAVTVLSEDYPERLAAIPTPPLALFCIGERSLLRERAFCVVGSRITPPWAEKLARNVSEELAARFAVVTGLAEGGDLAAVSGALPSGRLVCVLPCGVGGCYPAAHVSWREKIAREGLLVGESLDGKVKQYSFQARNRILAGLSEGVLVVSAGERSGALITADYALDFGRDVFAFPHNVGSAHGAGCNELIKRGAFLATGAEDILSVYGMLPPGKKAVELTEDEARVLRILRETGEMHAAELAERAALASYEAAALLSGLEMKGLAVKAGGNRYAAVSDTEIDRR